MPLKIRVKPEGKIFLDGIAVFKNVGNRPCDLLLLTEAKVSRSEEHAKATAIEKIRAEAKAKTNP